MRIFPRLNRILCALLWLGLPPSVALSQADAAAAAPFLGRWDVTLQTPQGPRSSWFDIERDEGALRVRMVGRWGHARWLKDVSLVGVQLSFASPRDDEGRKDGDMRFVAARQGEELVGTTTGPMGEPWAWRARRAPALRATPVIARGAAVALFAGKDIAAWLPETAKSWRVSDGTLVSAGGGTDLRSKASYQDFALHVEFNCAAGANGGIYLRGRYEVQIEDDGSQAADQRTGGVYGFLAPSVPVAGVPGRWHAYDITLVGRQVTVVLDGATLIDHMDIPGITGGALDSHEAEPGPIVLQGSEPGQVAFRNVVLTPLTASRPAPGPSVRVQRLLGAMTREEKLAVIRGSHEPDNATQGEAGWTRGVPRLGVPDLRFADGPPGVLVRHTSTGMPSTLSMASTFSIEDARITGSLIGRDARALGIDVILQPYINLYRDPRFERAYNTLGEDPLLTGTLAAAFVTGAQREHVMSQAKHFIVYEGADEVRVDGQALREIYAAPFADVARAGVSSVMCSYNRIEGVYACGNARLLDGILRGEDGFTGFITSDWGATHGAEFLTNGLDMEQPGTGPTAVFALHPEPGEHGMSDAEVADLEDTMTKGVPEEQRFPLPASVPPGAPPQPGSRTLGEALARGTVGDADLDRATMHVLEALERFGWLDRAPSHTVHAQAVEDNARAIRRLAARGAVLLKNDGVLPLGSQALRSLALIGPGALQPFAIVNGLEQSYGRASREIGPLQALKALGLGAGASAAVADDMTGEPVPADALAGLDRTDSGGTARPDQQIDHTLRSGHALPAGSRSAWSGTLSIPAEGDYEIDLQLLGATGKFSIDGHKVGDMGWWGGHGDIVFPNRDNVVPTTDGLDNVRRLVHLAAGPHALQVEVNADGSNEPVQARLGWVTPEMRARNFQAAVDLARTSQVAVVFAWNRNRPHFGLPGEQDRLIEAVAAVNPHTVVVLNTGQAVAMPWLDKVGAVLELWYTGDEGGWATVELLTGRANPGGKLPITWPRRLEDYAAVDPRHPERASPGTGSAVYSEGVHVGYRWFDREHIEPLFPFGYGLSYSSFEYTDLAVTGAADGGLDVRCRVRNTSGRDGDAVVEAYLGAPGSAPEGAEFAVRALAGFQRLTLRAGAQRLVELHVTPERLRYWSRRDHMWRDARADRKVYVGSSSRDLPLSAPVGPRHESGGQPP